MPASGDGVDRAAVEAGRGRTEVADPPCSRFQVAGLAGQHGPATPAAPTGRRCPSGRAATSGRRRRRSRRRWRPRRRRSRRPTGRRPAAPTRPPRARPAEIAATSSTRPVVHSTWDTATIRVSSPIAVEQPLGRAARTTRRRTRRAITSSGLRDAGVLLGRGHHLVAGLPVDARMTMPTPCVVELVSATCSGGARPHDRQRGASAFAQLAGTAWKTAMPMRGLGQGPVQLARMASAGAAAAAARWCRRSGRRRPSSEGSPSIGCSQCHHRVHGIWSERRTRRSAVEVQVAALRRPAAGRDSICMPRDEEMVDAGCSSSGVLDPAARDQRAQRRASGHRR